MTERRNMGAALGEVKVSARKKHLRVVLYGPEGIGKSTFAAGAPSPLFISAEDGVSHLGVAQFVPQTYQDVRDVLQDLRFANHQFETVVVDTLDWLEPKVIEHVVRRDFPKDPKATIETYGYGRGYDVVLDEWRSLLHELEMVHHKGMHVVLLAHSSVKLFKNPSGDDYERYELKLQKKTSGLVKEWPDALLFASYEEFTKKADPKDKKAKGIDTGARVVFTSHRVTHDAKNRQNLPDVLPLGWDPFWEAVVAGAPRPPGELKEEIRKLASLLSEEGRAKVAAALERAGDDVSRLSVLLNWAKAQHNNQQKE